MGSITKSFLNLGINFTYCGPLDTRAQSIRSSTIDRVLVTSSEANYQRAGLQIKLDALYKDFYEELNLILGADYNLLYYKVYSNDVEQNQMTGSYTSNGFTRTMRQLRYFNLNLGLEWRDYITEHFGYFIQLSYNPTIRTDTHSLLFERVYINGKTHPLEGTRIKPGENGLPEENFEFRFINLSLGLTYQW